MSRAFVSVALFILGMVLAILGYEKRFTFIGCPPGSSLCIYVYTLDYLAILIGGIAMLLGAIGMMRKFQASRA